MDRKRKRRSDESIGDLHISEWCLDIYPNDFNQDSKEYVSVFLILLKPEKIKIKLRFPIFNDKEEKENVIIAKNVIELSKNEGGRLRKFDNKDFLLSESSGLLINDKLIIFCKAEITELRSENHGDSGTSLNVTIPQSQLLLSYGSMFESSLYTDDTIKVGSTRIKVHKAVLAARSFSFHEIFNSTSRKSRAVVIEIGDFRVEVVREMLRYTQNQII